jgi:cyclopropane-fatty-acyl-phospholipid synthase
MDTVDLDGVSQGVRHAQEGPDASGAAVVGPFGRWLGARLQHSVLDAAGVRLELWDGSSPYRAAEPPVGDMVVRDQRTLLHIVLNPDLAFGEGYMSGRVAIRGSLDRVIEALTRSAPRETSWRDRLRTVLGRSTSLGAARRNVHHHYDLGNDFYRLWLDQEMVYTCAYFPSPEASLEEAQIAKLDLVCRKLRLKPGETVVEAGCGWGALALHMARRYGVRVKAYNVSREQLAFARERAAREGLNGRVEFIDDDYRNVSGSFDVFVSVGMLEHVGLGHFSTLAAVLRRSLRRDGGRGLLHFIGRDMPRPLNAWIRRRIFPGAYGPTLAEVTTRVLAPAGMSVIDVENLRLHYALTLDHWAQRFARAEDWVRSTYGEEFQRAWRLYLSGSRAAFATGWMQLFQIVFTPSESTPPSWTRSDPREVPGAPA